MHETELIFTLTMALGVALGLGFVTQRVGLSPIVGYLLAGVAVGPSTPGFVANHELAVQLAEVGVILLMFGVGLHFHVKELLAVRRVAIPGAIGQSLVATVLGTAAAWTFGWGIAGGIVFGLSISVASTVVLTRVLADNDDLHTQTGHIAIGWLVVEDLLTVVVLVLLPALVGGDGGTDLAWALGAALLKIAALVAIVLGAGRRLLPALLNRAANSGSRELFTLTVLVLALGIAAASTYFFDVSMALGAFLAGMVVGRSEFSQRAATEALPMRDAFAVLFFVSVGMLLDFRLLADAPEVILATLAIVVIGKPLAALAIVLALRYPLRVALGVAVALAQIGEFSFILGTLGANLGVIDAPANNALVAAAIVSIGINPLLYRAIDPVHRWWSGAAGPIVPSPPTPAPSGLHHAVIVGYGPVGRTLTRLLAENRIASTIIERNAATVEEIREAGGRAVCGDASRPEILREAGIGEAGTLVLSTSGTTERESVIRAAKALNPDIRVLVRTEYLRDAPALVEAGAAQVFAGEGEVALAMNEAVLRELGATPEQIDRERERLHEDLWGFARSTL